MKYTLTHTNGTGTVNYAKLDFDTLRKAIEFADECYYQGIQKIDDNDDVRDFNESDFEKFFDKITIYDNLRNEDVYLRMICSNGKKNITRRFDKSIINP